MSERITFFEIYQPFCSLQYGVGACPAVLGTDSAAKCFNTRATCPVPDSFTPEDLVLRFAMPQHDLLQYGYVLPCMVSHDTTPRTLNLAALVENQSALGQTETASVVMGDFLHDDHLVDKYRLQRISGDAMAETGAGYDPHERGTFWGKWLARNPYAVNYRCAIRQGEPGQALEDMTLRWYVIDSISGPSNGRVTFTVADLFSRVEKRKAVAPLPSLGELQAGISETANNAQLAPAGIGNQKYQSSGWLQIGDEMIAFTRAGDSLSLTERGALGSVASEHDAGDVVQEVLAEVSQLAHDIVYRLLTNYSQVPAAYIDKPAWDLACEELTELYTGHIGTPVEVEQLIGELSVQAGFTVFPNVETGMIELIPLRESAPTTVVDDDNALGAQTLIQAGSLTVKRQESRRVSQVVVYYAQINRAEQLDERLNYRARLVVADGNSLYDDPAIREVFSRWIPQFGTTFATRIGQRILAQFRDAPWEAQFDIKVDQASNLALGRPYSLRTHAIQDITGDKLLHTQIVTSLERGDHEVRVTSEQARYYIEPDDDGVRRIYLDTDANNVNLREVHDQLYVAPIGGSPGEQVLFIITEGTVVGSSATSLYALDTGEWPAGVQLSIEWHGRVAGAGGAGGKGGGFTGPNDTPVRGRPGGAGGTGFKARYAVTISGTGVCAGGGGGGGGGGSSHNPALDKNNPGGGGGGGAGRNVGTGGARENASGRGGATTAAVGQPGTLEAAGSGGVGGFYHALEKGGTGGAGGAPGAAGTAGATGVMSVFTNYPASARFSAGGAGGAAGAAIEGFAFITFDGSPSLTILGSTS